MREGVLRSQQVLNIIYNHIPAKLRDPETWSLFFKRLIYIAVMIWFCHIERVTRTEDYWMMANTKHYIGVGIAIITLTAYPFKSFLKLPYFIWVASFLIGRQEVLGQYAAGEFGEMPGVDAYVWFVGLYGLVILRLLHSWIFEKKYPRMHWGPFLVWLVMMVMMAVVRWDVLWSKSFLLFFLCFYLTNFEEKDLNNLLTGVVEGIVIGFVLMQGFAFLYRPYTVVRYIGIFSNGNNNAIFYVVAYTAVLCKWYQMKLKQRFLLYRLPLIALLGMIVGLAIMTMCRTALIVMVINTVFFLLFQMISRRRWKVLELVVDGVAIVASVLFLFAFTYELTRYLPAYVNEPVYFAQDFVHVNIDPEVDGPDSEKYVEFDEMWEQAFDRVLWFAEEEQIERIKHWFLKFTLIAEAAQLPSSYDGDVWEEYDEVYVEPGTDRRHPMLTEKEDVSDPVQIRVSIWRYYLEHLKFVGEREGVSDVWITTTYSAPHPHNILLFIAADFGVLVGALFLLNILLSYNKAFMGLAERKQGSWYYRLFVLLSFVTATVGFGMIELSWDYGQMSFTLLFLVQYVLYHRGKGKVRKPVVTEDVEAEEILAIIEEDFGIEKIY